MLLKISLMHYGNMSLTAIMWTKRGLFGTPYLWVLLTSMHQLKLNVFEVPPYISSTDAAAWSCTQNR